MGELREQFATQKNLFHVLIVEQSCYKFLVDSRTNHIKTYDTAIADVSRRFGAQNDDEQAGMHNDDDEDKVYFVASNATRECA